MIPAAFEYHAPASLDDATALLARLGEEAKILSGGQSLIPLMKLRLSSPPHVVDINGIPGLSYIREADGVLDTRPSPGRRPYGPRGYNQDHQRTRSDPHREEDL